MTLKSLQIEELISEYSDELAQITSQVEAYEEELGVITTNEDEARILKSIARAEEKKFSLERMIFDLKIKQAEIDYSKNENLKNFIVGLLTLLISFAAIYFAYKQNEINEALTDIELLNNKNLDGDIKNRIVILENEITALGKSDQAKLKAEILEIRKQLEEIKVKSENIHSRIKGKNSSLNLIDLTNRKIVKNGKFEANEELTSSNDSN